MVGYYGWLYVHRRRRWGGLGGGCSPPELGQMGNFWAQEVIFGHSWHAQKLIICPKVAKLPKNFSGNAPQPPNWTRSATPMVIRFRFWFYSCQADKNQLGPFVTKSKSVSLKLGRISWHLAQNSLMHWNACQTFLEDKISWHNGTWVTPKRRFPYYPRAPTFP